MTQNAHQSKITLKNLFIFNSKFGDNEGEEEEKIFYFHPPDVRIDTKMKEVGLTEAIIKFTQNFSSEECDVLQTQKTRKFFLQPEEDFWLIMTLNVPYRNKSADVMEGKDYLGDDIQNPIYQAVLRQVYRTAKLLIGPFESILEKPNGKAQLMKRMEDFFSWYIPFLRLTNCDILDLFQGVRFLPLDQKTFLHAQQFVNVVEANCTVVRYSILLYSEQIVWSGIHEFDARTVYRYIVNNLLPLHRSTPFPQNTASARNQRFVTGPDCLIDPVFVDVVPKVFLSKVDEPGFYHLIVYKIQDLIAGLFIPSNIVLKPDFFKQIDGFLQQRMTKIVTDITCSMKKSGSPQDHSDEGRYVYFNSLNLATKGSFQSKKPEDHNNSKLTLKVITEIHQNHLELQKKNCSTGLTMVKSLGSYWVVGQMSNSRHFYVNFDKKKANLTEVSEEVRKICDKQLSRIFFQYA